MFDKKDQLIRKIIHIVDKIYSQLLFEINEKQKRKITKGICKHIHQITKIELKNNIIEILHNNVYQNKS